MNKQTFTKKSSEDNASNASLRDMLAPLFRRRFITIVTFSSVLILFTLLAWVWAARYYSSSFQVLVEQERTDPPVSTGQSASVNNRAVTTDQVASEVALLLGNDMLRGVVKTCGLADEPSRFESIFPPKDLEKSKAIRVEMVARQLVKKIKVEAEKTSDVIDVTYSKMGEPETPACVLQTLSKLYIDKHLQLQRPAGATSFFEEEAKKYERALSDSELRLAQFSRAESIAAPDLVRSDMAQQFANSQATLYQTRELISADEKRIDNIMSQMERTAPRSATTEVSNSSNLLLQNLQAALLAAQIKRTQLLVKFEPDYPLVREADKEIAQTQEAIVKAQESRFLNQTTDRDPTYEFLRQDMAKTQADLASARARDTAITNSINSIRASMVALEAQTLKQAALVREFRTNEGNYLLYVTKREQERSSDALNKKGIANVAIAVPPTVPLLPVHSPWLVMGIGFIVAIASGLAAAFVAEHFDASFRTPKEVAEFLSIPVLASVPRRAA